IRRPARARRQAYGLRQTPPDRAHPDSVPDRARTVGKHRRKDPWAWQFSLPGSGVQQRHLDGMASASRSLGPCSRREDAAADLVALDRFEEGAEIAFAETVVAFALNDFEKDRADHGLGKDLQ